MAHPADSHPVFMAHPADSLGFSNLRGIRCRSNCACLFLRTHCRTRRAQIAWSRITGAPGAIRTRNLCLRRATLYPIEPRVQTPTLYDCMGKLQVRYPRCNRANIKSSKSPSSTAAESVFSTPVRTSLTNWYGYRT